MIKHKRLFFSTAILFLLLGGVVLLVGRATPGPSGQELQGIALHNPHSARQWLLISGRQLDCQPIDNAPYTSACTLEIAGNTLSLTGYRNGPDHPMQFGGDCTAVYANQSHPCQLGSPTVAVHWYAYIDSDLGLSAAQMTDLQRRYFFGNLPEGTYITSIFVLPVLATLLLFLLMLSLSAGARTRIWLRTAVLLGFFSSTFLFVFRLTSYFWD